MCGIVGYIGNKRQAVDVILNGLKLLEYRGYDSAGIAFNCDKKVKILKNIGKVSNLKELVTPEDYGNVGIAHTRWATHGKVSVPNAHPHKVGKITLVHNGIIENYLELKDMLLKEGYKFKSETDTEILCALIDKLYKENGSIVEALYLLQEKVIGSYATLVLCDDDLDKIYATRYNSPLILAVKDDEYFLTLHNYTPKL